MKIRIETQRVYDKTLREMAEQANLSVEDLAEVAVYNLIALYLRDKRDQSGELPEGAVNPLSL